MHLLTSLLAFTVTAADPWTRILDTVQFDREKVLAPDAVRNMSPEEATKRVQAGGIVILEGDSRLSRAFGFHPDKIHAEVRSVLDSRNPSLSIVWETPAVFPVYHVPAGAVIFASERWTGAPLMAGLRKGAGGVLWMIAPPGERGYERFPYIPHALAELGAEPRFRARDLWAFFDSSYRSRADVGHLASAWRRAGISALHVAAWHYNEPDETRDRFLQTLIEACHRNAILVYAWLELPHVSEKFWNDHPEWREKTGIGQDAHLDWRRLMNLQNPDCHREVAAQTAALIDRFDWDGVNMAELYFESLEGAANPARFTPFNQDVRRAFLKAHKIDPYEAIKQPGSDALKLFIDFRADLARRLQEDWVAELERMRSRKPHLDLVLTHVDDRFDTRMREMIGADAARVMPLVDRNDITFLIEDPATVWHLGPERYTQIAERYRPIAPRPGRLAIDINIVERYQDVYPTRQQTGIELFQLVHLASRAFSRVALYFENSIPRPDWDLLPAAAAVVKEATKAGNKLNIESDRTVGVQWKGPVKVNGQPWPVSDGDVHWLPPGRHTLEDSDTAPPIAILDFNGELTSAFVAGGKLELQYTSRSRAIAILDRQPTGVRLDGKQIAAGKILMLPRGSHSITVNR